MKRKCPWCKLFRHLYPAGKNLWLCKECYTDRERQLNETSHQTTGDEVI